MSRPNDKQPPGLWTGQVLHFTGLAVLLVLLWHGWVYLGKPFPSLFWLAVGLPIAHQLYVWITWRLELRNATITRSIGFQAYLAIFFVLFGGRFVTLAVLAWVDRGSLQLDPGVTTIGTILLVIPGVYAMHSVRKYFGMARAAGADHFDDAYRHLPLVKDGIFRFTNNGMYLYAFLLFWAIALFFNSASALCVAAYSHAYIWIHFHATEKPDMNFLYARAVKPSSSR